MTIDIGIEANLQYDEEIEIKENSDMTTEEYNRKNQEYLDEITKEREEFLKRTEGTNNPLLQSVRESYGE